MMQFKDEAEASYWKFSYAALLSAGYRVSQLAELADDALLEYQKRCSFLESQKRGYRGDPPAPEGKVQDG